MKKILLSILSIGFLATSCTKLDVEVYDQIPADKFPENSGQTELMVVPVYKELQKMVDNGGWWFAQEVPGDAMAAPTRHTDWDDGGKWRDLHKHNWNNQTEAISQMWGFYYAGVVEANKVIETIEPGASDPSVAAVIAQMKTMRAFYYYLLIDNYGDVPYVTSFSAADPQPSKMPRAEVYANVVAELEAQVDLLPEASNKTEVNKYTALTLLAKLYLNAEVYTGTAEWAKAEDAAQQVIDSPNYSLEADVASPFVTENEGSIENIFTIPYDEVNFQGFNLHMRTLHYQSKETFDMAVSPWNGYAVLADFYRSFDDSDLRKQKFFLEGPQYAADGVTQLISERSDEPLVFTIDIPALEMGSEYSNLDAYDSGVRANKFEVKVGAMQNLSNDYPIFRLGDVVLMKAEAAIRQGKSGDTEINMIRSRAGLADITGADLDAMLLERRHEMFWEGSNRQDLIRFGQFNRSWWEKDANDVSHNIFPIPQWAIDGNPNLLK